MKKAFEMDHKSSVKIEMLSFIFTIVIVAYHSNILFEGYLTPDSAKNTLSGFWEYIANVAMSFFFMKTALLLYNGATNSNISSKLHRRFFTVVIPFIVWNLIYFVVNIFSTGTVGNLYTILLHFSFTPYDSPLWYLFAITLLSLFAPIVILIKDRKFTKPFIVFLGFAIGIIYSFDILNTIGIRSPWLYRLFRYLPSYIFGMYIGLYSPNGIDRWLHKKIFVFFCLFIVSSMLCWSFFENYIHSGLKLIILFATPIIIWIMLYQKEPDPCPLFRNAFLLYAIHRLVIDLVNKLVEMSFVHEILTSQSQNWFIKDTVCALLVVLCCVLSWVVAYLINKLLTLFRMDSVVKILTGGR